MWGKKGEGEASAPFLRMPGAVSEDGGMGVDEELVSGSVG